MSRPILVTLGIVALIVGVAVGIAAGTFAGQPAASPVAVVTPSPAATGGGSPSPSGAPSASPSEAVPSPTPTPVPTATPEPTPVLVAAPLTGEPVSEQVATRRVVAVMVDDQAAARPQSGLSQADVVWHAPAEGGIPRYMALFQSEYPTQVGPIRSSRLYYIAWAAEWRSLYVHAGGSPQALALLNSAKGRGSYVYNADEFRWSRYLYRVRFRGSPHNVYSDAKNLRRLAKAVGADPVEGQDPTWTFAPDAPLDARPKGGTIVVPYAANRITYKYDRATNTYRRSVTGEGKQVDVGVDPKTRIAPKNVVIMKVRFVSLGDRKHRLDGKVTGTGTAWISTNGITVKGTWQKKSFRSPTRFFGPDGQPITLTIGQTFVQVVDRATRITIRDGELPAAGPAPTPSPTPTPAP